MSKYYQDMQRYADMLDLPHHQSNTHPHMSLHDRAAQFAPFAALAGHEDAIEETARLTEGEITLDETEKEKINEKLAYIQSRLDKTQEAALNGHDNHFQVKITYFKPDSKKAGGAYLTDIGGIRKIDVTDGILFMDSGVKIVLDSIVDIDW